MRTLYAIRQLSTTVRSMIVVAFIIVGFSGCSIDVPPPDLYSDPDAITDIESARSLLTSCYILYPHYEYDLSKLGNDFCMTNVSGKDVNQLNFYSWQDINISDFASECWLAYYNCIANIDVLQERIPNVVVTEANDSSKLNAVIAEANTLKAMCYFDLLRLFASAYDDSEDTLGIILKSNVGIEMKQRSSKKRCAEYIKSLLLEAASIDNSPTQNGWLSQKAAIYELAELALYTGAYNDATTYAGILIDGCDKSWISKDNYGRIWSSTSYAGRIFAFNTSNSVYADIQYSDTEGDYFALNPELEMPDGDVRKEWTEYKKEINSITHILFGKYNKVNKKNGTNSYINRMRYAGAYFITAEAYARLGNSSKAIETLNEYLETVGAESIDTSLSGSKLTDRILHEKYKEFAGEGQNYFDLKRTHSDLKKYGIWGNSVRTTIGATDYRWTFPIPASEYRYNEVINQNRGWQINR